MCFLFSASVYYYFDMCFILFFFLSRLQLFNLGHSVKCICDFPQCNPLLLVL